MRRSRRCPRWPSASRSICVDDGSRDGTGAIADRLAAAQPGVVRVVHHPRNRGYGAAVRSGLAAARFPLVCFTDGDRQFRVADVERAHAAGSDASGADVVAGYRIRRADPAVRLAYARLYRLPAPVLRAAGARPRLRLQAVPARPRSRASRSSRVARSCPRSCSSRSRRAAAASWRQGVPHHPRTAGRASGADPRVVLRAVRDFWRLRLLLWIDRERALERGRPVLRQSRSRAARGAPGGSDPRRPQRRCAADHGPSVLWLRPVVERACPPSAHPRRQDRGRRRGS